LAVELSGMPDKIAIPRIVRDCILFIEEKGQKSLLLSIFLTKQVPTKLEILL